ncbi:hypothetical protein [Streptomyces boninensis]|uniref:hypothetical protein n=1 Tax=Streptomyces boninensis TaxID=2039455 RepID=UPI003B211D77
MQCFAQGGERCGQRGTVAEAAAQPAAPERGGVRRPRRGRRGNASGAGPQEGIDGAVDVGERAVGEQAEPSRGTAHTITEKLRSAISATCHSDGMRQRPLKKVIIEYEVVTGPEARHIEAQQAEAIREVLLLLQQRRRRERDETDTDPAADEA